MSNHWEKQFGKARRASDKKLLQECERQIAAEEAITAPEMMANPIATSELCYGDVNDGAEERARIAKAFGRLPL